MVDEYFYGITLKGEKNSFTWDADLLKAEHDEIVGGADNSHKLLIKQILLGPEAKDGELNVIEVEALTIRDKVKIPIAVLKADGQRQISVDLEFPDSPVIFTLTQGTGPVHLLGEHLEQLQGEVDLHEEEDLDDEEDENDDAESDEESDGGNAKKKMKLDTNHKKAGGSSKNDKKK